jgi:homoserine dehydrogenase
VRVLLVGFGVVGQSFADLVDHESKMLDRDYGLRPKIVGIVDRKGAAISPAGIDIKKALISKKQSGKPPQPN